MSWEIVFSRQAAKDAKKIAEAGLKEQAQKLIQRLQDDPYQPPYEKLVGDMRGFYSRRINIQHRLVYQIFAERKTIKTLRMWSHYE